MSHYSFSSEGAAQDGGKKRHCKKGEGRGADAAGPGRGRDSKNRSDTKYYGLSLTNVGVTAEGVVSD